MKPPKAPLLMTRTTSPGRAPSATARTSRSTSASARASTPSGPEVGDHPLGVEPLVRGHHVVGLRHLEGDAGRRRRAPPRTPSWWMSPAARVRAGLEHRPQPPPREAGPDGGDRLPDGRRVVGEVVDDDHPAHLAAHLLPPPHAREAWRGPAAISSNSSPSARVAATTPSAFSTLWAPPPGSVAAPSGAAALEHREAGARPGRAPGRARRSPPGAAAAGARRSPPGRARSARSGARSGTPRSPRGSRPAAGGARSARTPPRSGRGRGRCPRGRTRRWSGWRCAAGSGGTSAPCRSRPCRTRRPRRRSAGPSPSR